MEKQKFFDSTIKMFEDYRRKMIEERPKGYNSNLSNEVHMRLWQLSFIYEKLRHYEPIVLRPTPIKEARKQARILDEAMIFGEAFYFFAWRIICIAKDKTTPLPGLKGLKGKAKGVVLVRNFVTVHSNFR